MHADSFVEFVGSHANCNATRVEIWRLLLRFAFIMIEMMACAGLMMGILI